MRKPERSDILRRRPAVVRYYYLAVSPETLHSGMSWGGLHYVRKHYVVTDVYLADLKTMRVHRVRESIDDFMKVWRFNYNDPDWEYSPKGG